MTSMKYSSEMGDLAQMQLRKRLCIEGSIFRKSMAEMGIRGENDCWKGGSWHEYNDGE